ncbi:CDP-alcohol phosphatidyltransferase family protein [Nocardia colli]|uniref:CDP-alcohol phosphatidyltransferase family protein n=1 Tax=Nocardia colli TaxID=2545717 RepID=A0A5N0EC99_9NOCA|nr:CDP-alcohol phosphatidyltransferase family protein [Nocardia colli]KAA8885824.1 CDP-alcohol phosphatidyltransferase family protein [Nocardia colli]
MPDDQYSDPHPTKGIAMLLLETATPPKMQHLAVLVTYVRLPLIPVMIYGVLTHSPNITVGGLILFVVLDILDGIFARKFGPESMTRRALDSTVDRAAIHSAFLAYSIATFTVPVVWLALIVRDCLQSYMATKAIRRGFIGVGALPHKALGIGTAMTGGLLTYTGQVPWPLTWSMVAGLAWCTITYAAQMVRLTADRSLIGIVQVPATWPSPQRGRSDT